jgi:glycerol-1-phosphate dehydrogenase [NAD(P)+]
MSGFAMQHTKTSRPASGAEHQFSHLWDMQHHTHNGYAPSHGFKVGIGALAMAQLVERLITMPLDQLDIEAAVAQWPDAAQEQAQIRSLFSADELNAKAQEETAAKCVSREQLRAHLNQLGQRWPELRRRLQEQMIPSRELKQMLSAAGAPVEPEQIGITRERLRSSFRQAYHIRRRYTALDLAVRAAVLERALA